MAVTTDTSSPGPGWQRRPQPRVGAAWPGHLVPLPPDMPAREPFWRRAGRWVLTAVAVTAMSTAGWYVAEQLMTEPTICPEVKR